MPSGYRIQRSPPRVAARGEASCVKKTSVGAEKVCVGGTWVTKRIGFCNCAAPAAETNIKAKNTVRIGLPGGGSWEGNAARRTYRTACPRSSHDVPFLRSRKSGILCLDLPGPLFAGGFG